MKNKKSGYGGVHGDDELVEVLVFLKIDGEPKIRLTIQKHEDEGLLSRSQ